MMKKKLQHWQSKRRWWKRRRTKKKKGGEKGEKGGGTFEIQRKGELVKEKKQPTSTFGLVLSEMVEIHPKTTSSKTGAFVGVGSHQPFQMWSKYVTVFTQIGFNMSSTCNNILKLFYFPLYHIAKFV